MKFKLLRLLSLLATIATLVIPTRVQAQTYQWQGVCVGGIDNDVATLQGLECLIANIFVVFITLIGLAGFVMFLFGSFKWLLAGSDQKNIQSARSIFTYAVLGLVLSLSAFIIINLIADFTGVESIKTFLIPRSDWVW
jgi:hypothetical protein